MPDESANVILDAEALSALAQPDKPKAAVRSRRILEAGMRNGAPAFVPGALLAELYRGTRADAALDRVLNGLEIIATGRRIARVAGGLLARDGLDSCHAIDAIVVATAIRLGGGIIVTHDPDDMRRLARRHSNVKVLAI